jgi:alkylated DNA nucleotide flippase Atl1
MDPEEYVERVLSYVEQVPPGRVTTYGAIADAVGVGGPRRVGTVMSTYGGSVPWWRVVRSDGTLPLADEGESRARHLDEGTPLRPNGRVDMDRATWTLTPLGALDGRPDADS